MKERFLKLSQQDGVHGVYWNDGQFHGAVGGQEVHHWPDTVPCLFTMAEKLDKDAIVFLSDYGIRVFVGKTPIVVFLIRGHGFAKSLRRSIRRILAKAEVWEGIEDG